MSYAIAIIFALLIIAVTIDVIRRLPKRSSPFGEASRPRSDEQFVTTQKIIVDLDRR